MSLVRYSPYQAIKAAAFSAAGNHLWKNRQDYGKRALEVAKSTINMAKRKWKSNGRAKHTKKRKSSARSAPANTTTTFQRDITTEYRKNKHRVPRSLKVFKAKVRAVEAEGRATQLLVMNHAMNVSVPGGSSDPGVQQAAEVHLYPFNGEGASNRGTMADIRYMLNSADAMYKKYNADGFEGINTGYTTFTPAQRAKVFMKSAHIEQTWYNAGTFPVEVEIFQIVYRKQPILEQSSLVGAFLYGTSYEQEQQNYVSATSPVTIAAVRPNLGLRGVTPFDVPEGLKASGANIVKAERFVIAPGQVVTKTHRDSRNRILKINSNPEGYCFQKAGFTMSWLTLYRSQGGTAVNPLIYRQTKSYRWTLEGVRTPKVEYLQTGNI